jgi:hypothetical protein
VRVVVLDEGLFESTGTLCMLVSHCDSTRAAGH